MTISNAELKKRLRIVCAVILVVGFNAAALIYMTAGDSAESEEAFAIANGAAYVVAPSYSKAYQHDLERFGGKTLVMFDDFNRWFAGLWRGKALAKTVAWISAILAFALYLFSGLLPSEPQSGAHGTDRNDKPG